MNEEHGVTHFAIHQSTPNLALWRTACGLKLANAAHAPTAAG